MRARGAGERWLGVALVAALAALPVLASAQDRATRLAEGERLFTAQGCYGCHQIGKFGTPIGPNLSRVGAKYTEADLLRWLADPASQKPNAHMPKLELSPAERTALAAYLAAQR